MAFLIPIGWAIVAGSAALGVGVGIGAAISGKK